MIPTEKRGYGAARKPVDTVKGRYGISPQLAPPGLTPEDKACLNSPCVATPQAPCPPGSGMDRHS